MSTETKAQHKWAYRDGLVFVENKEGDVLTVAAKVYEDGAGPIIAAAPDMLAALEALVATIPGADTNGDIAHEWLQARAAIARAKGDHHD